LDARDPSSVARTTSGGTAMRRLSCCLLALSLCAPSLAPAAEAEAWQPAPAQPAPAPAVQPQVVQPLPPPPLPPPAAEVPPPPPPPVLMQPELAQPLPPPLPVQTAPVQTAPVQTVPVQTVPVQPAPVQPAPVQPGVMLHPVPAQPGMMVAVPAQPAPAPAPEYAPRKMFHWGIGLSGGIGGGVSNYPGSAGFGLALLNIDGRFLIGTRMPDVEGGLMHAGLIDVHLGARVGVTAGDYRGHTLFGPLWRAGGGLDLGYQLLKLRPFDPTDKEKAQKAIGVAIGVSLVYEYFGRALLASVTTEDSSDITDKVAGGGLREDTELLVGPFIELSTPRYDPVKGKLKQKFMRLMLLSGSLGLYQVSLTWGSTF
jgi:hypothetical protein